jgi:Ni,Fe-hydrogenase III large subunit
VRVRVLLVGEQFKDADGAPWILLTGHQVFANGSDAPNAWTLSARVSGITVVRPPQPAETT